MAPIVALAGLAFIVYANLWNAQRRAGLTPRECELEDAEDRIEANIW